MPPADVWPFLGLDVRTLTAQLRATRLANEDREERPDSDLRRAA
jgi:hypothetical protein